MAHVNVDDHRVRHAAGRASSFIAVLIAVVVALLTFFVISYLTMGDPPPAGAPPVGAQVWSPAL
jgi:hypothetical protein